MKKPPLAIGASALLLLEILLRTPVASEAQEIQLLVRGDDFGMAEGNLEAVERAMNEVVMTCTSIIVPAP